MSTPGQAQAFMWLVVVAIAVATLYLVALIFSPAITLSLTALYALYQCLK